MSPFAYYCWLSEHRWLWVFRRRFQPRPDQDYPILIALLMPCLVTGLSLLGAAVLFWIFERGAFPPKLGSLYWLVGSLAFTAAALNWGFLWLSWNQRAARLRSQNSTASPTSRPGILIQWLLVYVLLLAVVTPLALLTALEHVRGAWKWKQVRTELIARGERLDIRDVVPATPPADQNFFTVLPFSDLVIPPPRFAEGIRGVATLNTNTLLEATQIFSLPQPNLPKRDGDNAGPTFPIPLSDWAIAFRAAATNQAVASERRYAAIPEGANDATAVLAALANANAKLAQICEATRRPRAVFPVLWEDGFQALLPHLALLRTVQNHLDVRVAAKLAQGDRAGAFADAECSLRLSRMLREEPLLISQLVHFAQLSIAARTVWRGIALHAWDDAQLKQFQQQFEQTDGLSSVAYGLEGERSGALSTFDRWIATGRYMDAQEVGFQGINLFPSGWVRQNQATLAEQYQRLLDTVRRLATNPPATGYAGPLKGLEQLTSGYAASAGAWANPYVIFARMLMPALDKAVEKGARADATARSAVTACGLERYRLRHGAYPELLSALVPEFLPSIPLDPMDNQPLRYAPTDDGLFRLWSIGENGKDDGGRLRASGEKKRSIENLDWPWPYPMP